MKRYFISALLLLKLATAQSIEDREFEIYFGMTYDIKSDSELSRRISDAPVEGYGFMLGLYVPIFYPFALSIDAGLNEDMVDSEPYESASFSTMYYTFLLTLDLDAHRLSAGLKQHKSSSYMYTNTDLNNLEFIDVQMNDNLGYVISYEYNFAEKSPVSFGLQYEQIDFKDALNNSYSDTTIMATMKMKIVGWEKLKDKFLGPKFY